MFFSQLSCFRCKNLAIIILPNIISRDWNPFNPRNPWKNVHIVTSIILAKSIFRYGYVCYAKYACDIFEIYDGYCWWRRTELKLRDSRRNKILAFLLSGLVLRISPCCSTSTISVMDSILLFN